MTTDELLQKREQVAAWLKVADERFNEKMRLWANVGGNMSAAAMMPALEMSKTTIPGFCDSADTAEVRQQLVGALWMLDQLIEGEK